MNKILEKFLIIIFSLFLIVNLGYTNVVKAEDTYSLTITKKTENNEEGEFRFKIKISGLKTVFTATVGPNGYGTLENPSTTYLSDIAYLSGSEGDWYSSEDYPVFLANLCDENDNSICGFGTDGAYRQYEDDFFLMDASTYELTSTSLYIDNPGNEPELNAGDKIYLKLESYYDLDNKKFSYEWDENHLIDGPWYEFTLNAGESLTIPDIPYGYEYEVYEETKEGWKLVDINGSKPTVNKGAGGISGTLNSDLTLVFNNYPPHDIEVNKTVTGSKGDKNKEFEFSVKVYSEPEWLSGAACEDYLIVTQYELEDIPEYYAPNYDEYYYPGNPYHHYLWKPGSELYNYVMSLPNAAELMYSDKFIKSKYTHTENGIVYPIYFYMSDIPTPVPLTSYFDLSEYGGVDNGDGTYTFTLKDGENFVLEDIPYGYEYEIVEKDYSSELYTTNVDGANTRTVSGTVTEDKSHEYVNDKDYADLTITKNVTGNMGDQEKEFTFKIRAYGWRKVFTDTISELLYRDGVGIGSVSFTNSENNQQALNKILSRYEEEDLVDNRLWADHDTLVRLYGSPYRVVINDDNKTFYDDDAVSSGIGGNGLWSDVWAESAAAISGMDENTKTITLEVYEYLDLSNYATYDPSTKVFDEYDGWYTFTLKHGESLTIPDIPVGYTYEIEEVDYSSEGYSTFIDNGTSQNRSITGTMDADKSHTFTNENSALTKPDIKVVKTADKSSANLGDDITYTITVTNEGDGKASDITVTDTLSSGLTYKSSSPEGTNNNQVTTWTIDELAAGGTKEFTLVATVTSVPSDNKLTNSVSVTNPEDPDTPVETLEEVTLINDTYRSITYKLNGGTYNGSADDIVELYKAGTIINVHAAPVREGYRFLYWRGSQYMPNDKYTVVDHHTFTAIWEKITSPTPTPTDTPTPTPSIKHSTPDTGDAFDVVLWSGVALSAILIALFSIKTLKHNN